MSPPEDCFPLAPAEGVSSLLVRTNPLEVEFGDLMILANPVILVDLANLVILLVIGCLIFHILVFVFVWVFVIVTDDVILFPIKFNMRCQLS